MSHCHKILIGRFGAPFGVSGWSHINTYGQNADSFTNNPMWWCNANSEDISAQGWRQMKIEDIKTHSKFIKVKLEEVNTRDAAAQWTNGGIAVWRDALSPLVAADEYYWRDLIGLQVYGEQGQQLGRVSNLLRISAHDILLITSSNGKEILIPFIDSYIDSVDIDGGRIDARWQANW